MAARRFLVAEVVEALRLWHAGHSIRRLAKSVGMGRVRLREVIARVQEAGVVPGDRSRSAAEWEELVLRLFPERVVARTGGAWERIEPYHAEIVAGLETNTVSTARQRPHDERGLEVSVSSFRRYVRQRIRGVRPEDVKVPKDPMPPGQVSEVDYGRLGRWVDPLTGRGHVVEGFVMALGSSRKLFLRPVLVCDQEAWAQCHVAAFRFFGGAPQQVRLDNLKAGVVRPDIYDPALNQAYQELGAYYRCFWIPAGPGGPRTSRRWSERCPTSGTASSRAANSRAVLRCRRRRSGGAERWRTSGRTSGCRGRWATSSSEWSGPVCCRFRPSRSRWPTGPRRPCTRTARSRCKGRGTRCRGG